MKDPIGNILRITPRFRGKWRLQQIWERSLTQTEHRLGRLPDGSIVDVNMDIPYERMVWLQAEEWDDLRYLQHRLRPNDTFVDVGANIGLWTLVAASAVGKEGRVFSFEPNPVTFQKLVANIERNRRTNVVTAFQQAVSHVNGSLSFSCPTQHNLSAIADDANASDVISVESVSLDSVVHGTKVAGIKLDTEGHELFALEGALETIENSSPWLIIEFNTTLLALPVLADWQVYRFLVSLGYKPFRYSGRGEAHAIAESFSIHGYCNILFQRMT
jgi:FkbM family methyltransferase